MPVLLILLAIVLLWMYLTHKARMRTRDCRWREDRSRDTADGRYFICMSCGAETFCQNNLPPPVCLSRGAQRRGS